MKKIKLTLRHITVKEMRKEKENILKASRESQKRVTYKRQRIRMDSKWGFSIVTESWRKG